MHKFAKLPAVMPPRRGQLRWAGRKRLRYFIADKPLRTFSLICVTTRIKRDPLACLQSWSDELQSRANRVRRLIGGSHWLSDGHHKEEIVREMLIRHLPPHIRVTRGFVVPANPSAKISKEIDILITDAQRESPWFFEGNLVITPPGAVKGQLHVKTAFNPQELADVIISGSLVVDICTKYNSEQTVWSGAIFFNRSPKNGADVLRKILKAAIRKARHAIKSRAQVIFPEFVAIVGGPILLAELDKTSRYVQVRAFDCPSLGTALLFSSLFNEIRNVDLRNRRSQWDYLIGSEDYKMLFAENHPL